MFNSINGSALISGSNKIKESDSMADVKVKIKDSCYVKGKIVAEGKVLTLDDKSAEFADLRSANRIEIIEEKEVKK